MSELRSMDTGLRLLVIVQPPPRKALPVIVDGVKLGTTGLPIEVTPGRWEVAVEVEGSYLVQEADLTGPSVPNPLVLVFRAAGQAPG